MKANFQSCHGKMKKYSNQNLLQHKTRSTKDETEISELKKMRSSNYRRRLSIHTSSSFPVKTVNKSKNNQRNVKGMFFS